jgi:hypothetical protein
MSQSEVTQQTVPAPFRYPDWPTTRNLPNPPRVTAVFKGLIAFSYNRNRTRAELVFNDGDNRHNLRITAEENGQVTQFPSVTSISLGVEGQPEAVHFLEQGSDKDFGYLLNLNDQRFYPNHRPPKSFGIKLIVTQGTFYTYELTRCRFSRSTVLPLSWGFELDIGRLAKYVGVDFELAENQQVTLTVNGEPKKFPTESSRTALITFDNECKESTGALCKHNRRHVLESSRGDFHYHRKVLGPLGLNIRYGLEFATHQLSAECRALLLGDKQSNDEAPCTGAGYSGSNGLPPDN